MVVCYIQECIISILLQQQYLRFREVRAHGLSVRTSSTIPVS